MSDCGADAKNWNIDAAVYMPHHMEDFIYNMESSHSFKRLVQSLSVGVVAVAIVVTATLSPSTSAVYDNTEDTIAVEGCTAGAISTAYDLTSTAYASATVETSTVSVVASADTEEIVEEAEEEETVLYPDWADKLMITVDSLNVREEADIEADIVGKMHEGDVATVISEEDGWYYITSGNVTGYASADYCVVGDEAYELSLEVCSTVAKASTGGVRVRSEASTDSSILTTLGQDDTIEVDLSAEEIEGWIAVIYNSSTGYVSADLVTVSTDYGEAVTLAEEQAAAKAAAAKATTAAAQRAAILASSDDVTILAALIQLEAGSECYEGKVAVGAVVCNRVRSSRYPNTVTGVIYQSGQFSTASRVASVISSGVSSSCLQAAQQALNGYDNTGGATSFRPISSGRSGLVIGNQVFF